MPYLAIAHLPFGESHHLAASGKGGVGVFGPQRIDIGGGRVGYGIRLTAIAIAPTVENHQESLVKVAHCRTN